MYRFGGNSICKRVKASSIVYKIRMCGSRQRIRSQILAYGETLFPYSLLVLRRIFSDIVASTSQVVLQCVQCVTGGFVMEKEARPALI